MRGFKRTAGIVAAIVFAVVLMMLGGGAVAGAAVTGPTYSPTSSGYIAPDSGARFSQVSAHFYVRQALADPGRAPGIALSGFGAAQALAVQYLSPASGFAVWFGDEAAPQQMTWATPLAVGDYVTLTETYSPAAGTVGFAVCDTTTRLCSHARTTGITATMRQAGVGITMSDTPAPGQKIVTFSGVSVRTYNGAKHGLISWFTVRPVVEGTAASPQASPSVLTGAGTSFTVAGG